ncbi:epidermal growth factor receptor kinase substrate 8 [Eupeodes corollae]|uniref:epidermal growth factor receptor kinase substrate 8 n=1 Tax=Eupeodes corollae TaxID=290404 RepID=UPI0024933939|nr:epidermal growth factor receptor kinase substrate 8 [Eupeodes corollae]
MGRTSLNGSSAADNLSSLFRDLNHHQNNLSQTNQNHQTNGLDHDDKPIYAMDHLATFKVKHESELKNPIEKIKLLKDTNVCPQKMFMKFNGQWIVILDQDQVEIESFPGSLIHEPAALISKDPLEEFNNMLVFSVSGSALGNTEMHVFQVEDASAVELVEDLKLVRHGKIVTQRRNRIEPKPLKHQIPNGIRDQYGIREAMLKSRDSEDTKERDINVLNHCFEDIEKFVFRLHYAAEALDELQNRKQQNKLNSNPHGEGLLVLRSRPPVENEFMDIFAKFKLAFNFSARLQKHMSKEKSPIDDMFVSLGTIVVICNDVYVNQGIPQGVVNPLLRKETINYMESCVTPSQRDFWQSLGKNWTLPKESFKDHKGSYHPIFFDDWSPDFIVDEPVEYIPPPPVHSNTKTEGNLMHDITNATWHRKLKSRNVRIAEVTHPRPAHTDKELSVVKGEYLEIIDDSRNWWKARNNRGQIGYVPNSILNPHNFETSEASTYLGQVSDTESLSSSINDQAVMESGKAGRTSLYAYETEREMPKQVLPRRSLSEPSPPPPPPPPPGETPPPTPINSFQKELALAGALVAMRARNDCDTENLESQDVIQEELRQSMLQREKRRDLEILKTPQIYIEASSTSKEVEEWLRKKGFSDQVIKKLHGLNGSELFALPDETVDGYFCKEDSQRLKSQVLLQKKFSGFKTTRSNELQAILARRRKKADATILEEADEV